MSDHSFCKVVAPSDLGHERLREIESTLASCAGVVGDHLADSGFKSRMEFFKELMRRHRPGCGCLVGSAEVSSSNADLMMRLKEVESDLLSHFSMMIERVVRRCARVHSRDSDGLHADAYEGFFRAMLNYDGSVRFSTFLHACLVRHLARACSGDSCVRVPDRIRRLSMRVVGRMGRGESFDSAVEGMDEASVQRVVASMGRVRTATDMEVEESDLVAVEDRESLEWVSRALEGVEFTVLERAALKGFMESPSGVMGLSEGMEGLVNPATGRPYSRAAVSAAWRQARKKIARVLEAA